MKISSKSTNSPGKATVELNPMETTALRAALGEVCYGFDVPDFNLRMGTTESEARKLFEKMDQLSTDQPTSILLTMSEVHLLKKAHEETLNELGAEEYGTRTGVRFAFGQDLLKEFSDELRAAESEG